MCKPFTDVFYLSYTGIIQTKRFNKLKSKQKNEQTERISGIRSIKSNMVCLSTNGRCEYKESHKKSSYKLNKSKVRKRCIAFSRLSKSKKHFYFYTISFPSQLPDNQCFEVFNICLTRLRKESMISDYLWITERQKNSTLHFHILTNDLFSVQKMNHFVRSSLLYKLNRKEFEYDRCKIENYNGVDIAKNRTSKKVTNFALQKDNKLIINYLTKYITKNDISFYRLPFHSSHSISKLIGSTQISEYEAVNYFLNFDSRNTSPKIIKGDFFAWYGFSKEVSEEVFEVLDFHNELIYNNLPFTETKILDQIQPTKKSKIIQLNLTFS